MNNLRYPVLSEEELVEFFNSNFLMSINLADFINPNKDMVINILDKFFADFGIEYRLPNLSNTAHITNMTMHQASIPLINMKNHLERILGKAGFDFRLSDLIRPQRRRNQILFSQIIGFWTQFFDVMEQWKGYVADKEVMALKNAELRKENEKKKQLLEEKLLSLSDLKEKLPDPEGLLVAKEKKLNELKDKADQYKSIHKANKEKKAKLRLLKMDLVEEVASNKERIESLKGQIVKSPEKVFAKTRILEQLREEARNELQSFQQQLLEKRSSLEALKEKSKGCVELNSALEDFKTQKNHFISLVTQLNAAEEETATRDLKTTQLDIKIATTRELIESIHKEKATYAKNHERQMAVLREMNDEMQQKLSAMKKEKSEKEESTDNKINHIEQEIGEEKEKREKLSEESEKTRQLEEKELVDFYNQINVPLKTILENMKNEKVC
ncbi:WD repeat-containing protein 87-like [Tetranychus urticae]|uniref:Kinetochore protein Nuf2 N-terminal domain-containing protein n=1 Tax=Tetranychus urticae TaxID=32264 RepID=T1K3L8_TETUR|nr:WD repeat-containing protein 87-like [Tetranychus urticae]